MKEWVTLVNESKTVENLNTIEFNLANAEFHDEFRLYIEVDKNANSDTKQHNLKSLHKWYGNRILHVQCAMEYSYEKLCRD